MVIFNSCFCMPCCQIRRIAYTRGFHWERRRLCWHGWRPLAGRDSGARSAVHRGDCLVRRRKG